MLLTMTNESMAMLLYLVAAIFFILALRGLSSPHTARSGNMFGMMQNQQNIANQQAMAEAKRRDEDAARTRTNMMIFGGIGGAVVLGLVVWLAVRKSYI